MFTRRSVMQVQRLLARCEGRMADGEVRRGGRCVNSVQLLGYVTRDPLKTGNEVKSATRFNLATTVYFRDQDEGNLQSKTTWHNIVVFKPSLQNKVNNYVIKGSRVSVQGSLGNHSYEDEDGVKRTVTNVIPDDVIILRTPVARDEDLSESHFA